MPFTDDTIARTVILPYASWHPSDRPLGNFDAIRQSIGFTSGADELRIREGRDDAAKEGKVTAHSPSFFRQNDGDKPEVIRATGENADSTIQEYMRRIAEAGAEVTGPDGRPTSRLVAGRASNPHVRIVLLNSPEAG